MEVITAGKGKAKLKVTLNEIEYYEVQEDFCFKTLCTVKGCDDDRIKNDVIVCNALYLHCVERGFKPCQI